MISPFDALPARGRVLIEQRDAHDRLLNRQYVRNLVTTSGRNVIRDLLAGGGDAPAEIALGTSGATPSSGDTNLVSEVFRKGITQTTTGSQRVTFRVYLTSTEGNGQAFREAGIFTAAGVLLARVTFAAAEKTSSDTFTLAWTLSIGAE